MWKSADIEHRVFNPNRVPLFVKPAPISDQRRHYLASLKFEQIDARHATIKTAHSKTCKWLLNKCEYRGWLDGDKLSEHNGFLWIEGKLGTR